MQAKLPSHGSASVGLAIEANQCNLLRLAGRQPITHSRAVVCAVVCLSQAVLLPVHGCARRRQLAVLVTAVQRWEGGERARASAEVDMLWSPYTLQRTALQGTWHTSRRSWRPLPSSVEHRPGCSARRFVRHNIVTTMAHRTPAKRPLCQTTFGAALTSLSGPPDQQ